MRRNSKRSARILPPRRGHALLMAVVVLTLSSAILTTAVRSTLLQYRSAERQIVRQQADCISESALNLGLAEYQRNPHYRGQEWALDVPDIGPANVQLSVEQFESGQRQLRVKVVLPTDAPATEQLRVDRRHALPAPHTSASE